MKKRIILFLTALVTWSLLTWPPDSQHLTIGILAAIFVSWLTGDLFIQRPYLLKHPHRYWYFFVYYIPVFLWEMLKANIDVAYRVLHPKLLINPGIVKVKTKLRSDTALTFLANSIT
ncbi:MAG: Na+/H+ antiporter subunit E, partial [Candidatus Omnitrophota bacterium]